VGLALAVSGAGYAGAGVLADPAQPFPAIVALGVGSGAAMVATVLLRALLYAGAGGVVDGDALAGFHARVWGAVPLGALVGGLVARAAGVSQAVTAAGLLVALTGLAVTAIPAWPVPTGVPRTSSKK